MCNLLEHFALYITHYASRITQRQERFRKLSAANSVAPHPHQATSVQPHQTIAARSRSKIHLPAFCITTEYTASQSAHPLSLACPFGKDEYLRGQVFIVHCKLESPLRELDEWTVNAHKAIRALGKISHLLWPHDGQLMHLGPLLLLRINRVPIAIPPSNTLAICAIIPARDKVILPSNLCPSALTRCKYQISMLPGGLFLPNLYFLGEMRLLRESDDS